MIQRQFACLERKLEIQPELKLKPSGQSILLGIEISVQCVFRAKVIGGEVGRDTSLGTPAQSKSKRRQREDDVDPL